MPNSDMTMSEMLHDPMIRQMLRADRVSLTEFARLLDIAANARHLTLAALKRPASLPPEWALWRCSAAQAEFVQQANILLKRC